MHRINRRSESMFDGGDTSSDDEDDDRDAFGRIAKKKPRIISEDNKITNAKADAAVVAPPPRRHHHINAARQAKMDALLVELSSTKPTTDPGRSVMGGGGDEYGSLHDHNERDGRNGFGNDFDHHFTPQKKGSFVEPGMEHLTTNIFVGNLDPTTTEEELTDAFRRFGDLYSVKIMWPRNNDERSRNRNTGFVCFMHRTDAEDAMDSLDSHDPFDTGRRLLLRWGKNVKMNVKFGTGGVPTNLRKVKDNYRNTSNTSKQSNIADHGTKTLEVDRDKSSTSSTSLSTSLRPSDNASASDVTPVLLTTAYNPAIHLADSITVNIPSDPRRCEFITTVASFVSKDGSALEQKLIETHSLNRDYQFLTPHNNNNNNNDDENDNHDEVRFEEHIFYRWRVYSFSQGDGYSSWRTDPFIMIEPHGRFWIPPPLNTLAAQEEIDAEKSREDAILASQEERRKNCSVNTQQDGITTGAQMRRLNADNNGGAGVKLNQWERKVFHELLYEKLCASQESICETMAFAFDKSGAAHEISQLLLAAVLDSGNEISVDTRIARLFLLSDILFNSQQPGVKNAFHYRDAIEAMSPTVFESLGRHRGGRMTKNRLRKAVLSVLGAWANWSVYTTDFLDELESKFEGHEIKVSPKDVCENFDKNEESLNGEEDDTPPVPIPSTIENNAPAMLTSPQGTWTTANNNIDVQCSNNITTNGDTSDDDLDGESIDSIDGEEFDVVHDGEYVLDGVEQEKVA